MSTAAQKDRQVNAELINARSGQADLNRNI
jgi:hypothetical protein